MNLIPWSNKRRSSSELSTVDRPLADFRTEIETLFDRFFEDPWGMRLLGGRGLPGATYPQIDLSESDKDVTIRAELPGVRPEDVDIEVRGNTLRLSGEKSEQREDQAGGQFYSERRFGRFQRNIQLPGSVDPDKIDARYKDGVLTITLAKHPEAQPRKVTVRHA